MPDFFVVTKFSPNDTSKVRGATDPMVVYSDWPSAEAAAKNALMGITDGSQFAIFQAVAVAFYTAQPVSISLLGATLPTTV